MGHFRSLRLPRVGHFRSFRSLKPKFLPRAFARLSHAFRSRFAAHTARFGSYLCSICISEAEAWTCESSDCPLQPHGTTCTPERGRSHLCHDDVSTRCSTDHRPVVTLSEVSAASRSGALRADPGGTLVGRPETRSSTSTTGKDAMGRINSID